MYTSHQIANYFIEKSNESAAEMTPMKLIKLAYIAHGWHLGLYDTILLNEPVYAWKYGPVIYSLYSDFKKYGNEQINELYTIEEINWIPKPDQNSIPFLEAIWKNYGNYNGVQLSIMTHQPNSPWDKVWNQGIGRKTKWAVIENDIIKEHYKEKAAANANLPAHI